MRTVTKTVYSYDELSEPAKAKARDWFRELIESDELADYDDWTTIGDILGIEFKQIPVRLVGGGTRHDPRIFWKLSYSQGDGASFEAYYRFARQAPKRIRAYAPQDVNLHAIADALAALQKRNGYALTAQTRSLGRGVASYNMDVDVSDARKPDEAPTPEADAGVTAQLRAFADWIYDQVCAQNDYLTSDEAVADSIKANDYEFEADGTRTRD